MEITLDEDDIINEINKSFQDDTAFIVKIVDKTTTSWESVRTITRRLLWMLEEKEELLDIIEDFR